MRAVAPVYIRRDGAITSAEWCTARRFVVNATKKDEMLVRVADEMGVEESSSTDRRHAGDNYLRYQRSRR